LDGVYARRKLQFTPQAQRREELLNCIFRLHFPDYSDASHGSAVMSLAYLSKSLLIPEYRKILERSSSSRMRVTSRGSHLRNLATGLPGLASFGIERSLSRLLRRRRIPYTLIAGSDGTFPLEFNSEQTPLWTSRVALDGEPDQAGVRGVLVDWKVSEDDVQAAKRAFVVLRRAIGNSSACTVEFDEDELLAVLRQSRPIGGHHIGTTRMASSPRRGIVDTNCAVFGSSNLYVASSATFPTSGHANPTLTIVAMAIRMGAHLAGLLAPSVHRCSDTLRSESAV
jgi:choline dehydrogenase-like flavoprotein